MDNRKMGNLISDLRRQKSMTQKDLADQLNVTDKAVSKWERGICCPDIGTIPELAELLGISSEELLDMKKSTGDGSPMHKLDSIHMMIIIVFKAVGLAMGIAALVTSIIGQVSQKSQIFMLAIAAVCFGLVQIDGLKKDEKT